jgi:O-antigen/teichoic acid export membrane protein
MWKKRNGIAAASTADAGTAAVCVSEAVSAPEPPFEGVGTATGGHYTGLRLTAPPLKRLSESLRSIGLRRSATAVGIYVSVGFGFLGTLFAARQLGPEDFGLLAVVVVATGFFQSLLDLTAEEALVKYGFDYAAAESWGRLHRLFRQALLVKGAGGLAAGVVLVAIAPAADSIFGGTDLTVPFLVAALLPLLQSPEGVASAALILRERYDIRAWLLASSMGLRMTGLAVGAHFGVTEAVIGIVVAQVVATALLAGVALAAFRRFPAAAPLRLEEDRRGILRFVFHSSLATGVVSLRGALAPLLLGIVSKPVQVGFFRIAQAPQQGLASLSAPARLIMLTEQTRDWARGATAAVFTGVRRYASGAALLMALLVPPVYILMPWLVEVLYGEDYEGASEAARLVLLAGALQFVFGWSKSLPVSIGRPGLRVLAHGVESVVMIPLVVVLGREWGATGAAGAVLASTVVFCLIWVVLLAQIRGAAA